MKSNHIMEGNLLYSELTDLNVNIILKKMPPQKHLD